MSKSSRFSVRFLSAVLSISLMMYVSASSAAAAQPDFNASSGADITFPEQSGGSMYGDYEYSSYNGEVTIKAYLGADTTLDIPSEIEGLPVTSLSYQSFQNHTNLTQVNIPDTVKSIQVDAFAGCSSLKTISIPSSVTSIGRNAFGSTAWLKNFPSDLVTAGDGILIKYKGTSENVFIPDTVKVINDYAFSSNRSLISLDMSDSVTMVKEDAFSGCSLLGSIRFSKALTEIRSCAFENCSSLTELAFPDSLTKIGAYAFQNCKKLSYVIAPSSVTTIDSDAFRNTPWLDNPMSEFLIAGNNILMKYCGDEINVTIPDGVTKIYSRAFEETPIRSVVIPRSVKFISSYCFKNCTSLESAMIAGGSGEGVTEMYSEIFKGCTSLKEVFLGNDLKSVGGDLFKDCDQLESFIIGDKLSGYTVSFADGAPNLKLKYYTGQALFSRENCDERGIPYEYLDFKIDINENGTYSLEKYYGVLGKAEIPSEIEKRPVTVIDDGAFANTRVVEVTIPDTVTMICAGSFSNCSNLTSVTIPDSVTQIEADAFADSPSVTIVCGENSYARQYAKANSIPYKAGESEPEIPTLDSEVTPKLGDTESDKDSDKSSDITTDSSTDSENYTETDTETETGTDTETETDTNTDTETFIETDTYIETDTETETDYDTETDTEAQPGSDTDSEDDFYDIVTYGVLGDVDYDAFITASDAMLVLRASIGIDETDETFEKLADVDGDRSLMASDALAILRYSVGFDDGNEINEIVRERIRIATTVYVKNSTGKGRTLYLYYWGISENCPWPGCEMTDPDGDGWYEYTVHTLDEFKWLIVDDSGEKSPEFQTKGDVWATLISMKTVSLR